MIPILTFKPVLIGCQYGLFVVYGASFDEVSIYNFILIIVFESFVINIKSYLTSMNSNAQVSPMLGKT